MAGSCPPSGESLVTESVVSEEADVNQLRGDREGDAAGGGRPAAEVAGAQQQHQDDEDEGGDRKQESPDRRHRQEVEEAHGAGRPAEEEAPRGEALDPPAEEPGEGGRE